MSSVTCHMLCDKAKPTAAATDPAPANFNTMHGRLVRQDKPLCLGEQAYLFKPHIFF